MTNIGELLGNKADKLAQDNIKVGDVHMLPLNENNGITPKGGAPTRNKFFIVLGFDKDGNVIGGLVINSRINLNLPSTVTDYQLPITTLQCPFLSHNSFVNCSMLIRAPKTKFSRNTYRGEISDSNLMKQIIETVKESPATTPRMLKDFGII